MLYVLYGQDSFRAREELRAIRQRLDTDGNLAHNTIRLDRDKPPSLEALRGACQSQSFFAEQTLVIVEGLMSRFTNQRRGRRNSKADDGVSEMDQCLAILLSLTEKTTVVILDEAVPAAFLEAVNGQASVKHFPFMRASELRNWTNERIRRLAVSISPPALDRLLILIDGSHLGELANEIDKLATYAMGRRIEVDDVNMLVSAAVEFQTWDLTDAVIGGRAERALSVVQGMDRGRFPAQLLLFMITRQYRQLMVAQALLKEGLNAAQIGAHLGIRSEFPQKKLVEQATRYAADKLEASYRRILKNDFAVKTGVLEAETALDLLIVDLTELAGAPRHANRR